LGGDRKNGPKRRVLRRLGHRYVFFYLFRVLLILTVLFRSYSRFKTTGRFRLAGDERNGPKVCFFSFLRVFAY
jgi:hypothetical protein